jgi:hypothetical protein
MHRAVRLKRIGQADAVGAAPAIDKHHHIGTQVALVVEHITAQCRRQRKGRLKRLAQGGGVALHLGGGQEAAQLWREFDGGHAAIMPRAGRHIKLQLPATMLAVPFSRQSQRNRQRYSR